jgi:hypothetical protein
MSTIRPLNLDPVDRLNCVVTFNVNRFEIYHANGWLMSAAYDTGRLNDIIGINSLECTFDKIAERMYTEVQLREAQAQ